MEAGPKSPRLGVVPSSCQVRVTLEPAAQEVEATGAVTCARSMANSGDRELVSKNKTCGIEIMAVH